MKPGMEVVTLGECMGVCFPSEPVTLDRAASLTIDVAGTEANTAIGLTRLGHPTRFIGRVGNDPFGRRIRATLDAELVDTTWLIVDRSAPTGVFFREWLPDGSRRVYYYRSGSAASHVTTDDIGTEGIRGARIVHLSGITPALSDTCAAAVGRAIALARAEGLIVTFDPNYRAPLWDPETARRKLLPLMREVDILLMSHEDAATILGANDVKTALESGAALGPATVVLKQAGAGASALTEGVRVDVPGVRLEEAIDPVGAGDGFNSGFLAGWLRGYDTRASLELGAAVGAAAASTLGDYAGYPRQPNAGTVGQPSDSK